MALTWMTEQRNPEKNRFALNGNPQRSREELLTPERKLHRFSPDVYESVR